MSINYQPLLYVVIPCHNGYSHTKLCLTHLAKSDYPNFNTVVVDDGSTDGTSAQITAEFPSVRVLRGDGNLWWSGAMNLGIKYALQNEAQYIFVLNNDVIVSTDTISQLVRCALQKPNCIIGSLIYDTNNPQILWSAGGILKWPWPGEIQTGMAEADNGQYTGIIKRQWTPGMGTLISKEILISVGLYDEKNLPQYLADVDYCLRANKAGYTVYISSNSKLYNNIDNTGGVKKQGRYTIEQIKDIFASLRSAEYLPARLKFISRHCPWYLFIPAVFIRYSRLFVHIIKS